MQLPPPNATVNGPFAHPERKQLPPRNHPMLPSSQLGDRPIPCVSR